MDSPQTKWENSKDEARVDTLRARIAALEAQIAERGKVKALPWEQNWANDPNSQWALVRDIDRSYVIEPESNVVRLSTSSFPSGEFGSTDMGLFPNINSAKSAAQADFDRRILSALEATPPAPKVAYRAPVEDEELQRWADLRADDAGRLARELISYRRTVAPAPKVTDEMVQRALEFVARWCWRTDPPNASNKLTDAERLSVIKFHPTIKRLGHPHVELADREAAALSGDAS